MKSVKALTCLAVVAASIVVSVYVALRPAQAQAQTPAGTLVWDGPKTPPELDSLSWKEATNQLAPEWEQASAYKASGDWDAAGDHYIRIAEWLPISHQTMSALLLAARCRGEADRTEAARALYDEVVAIGRDFVQAPYDRPRLLETKGNHRRLIGERRMVEMMFEALCKKCELEHAKGQPQNALATAAQLRAEFPEYHFVRKVLPVEAAITGAAEEQLRDREKTVSEQCDELWKIWETGEHEAALALADGIVAEFPTTAAALRATHIKAKMLWQESRYDEAKQVCQGLLEACGTSAPEAPIVRDAQWRVAWVETVALAKDLILNSYKPGSGFTEADWQRARDGCDVVSAWDPDIDHRSEMDLLRVELYYWQGRYAEAIDAAQLVYDRYGSRLQRDPEAAQGTLVKRNFLYTHYFQGFVHLRLGDPATAIEHFDIVIAGSQDDLALAHGETPLVASGYCGKWIALSLMPGNKQEAEAIKGLVQTNWRLPGSFFSRGQLARFGG
jgi:tetratricopeptide (TPR) repeat protein